ncbi:MAG: hypothetical protein ABIP33_00905 [Pseudolysinimonas sp.]
MPAPDASPRRRRSAPDLRLVLGVLLVVGSVAGVYGIVAAADRRVTVYAAASALTPGERIDAGDLVRRSVALDGSDRLYLAVATSRATVSGSPSRSRRASCCRPRRSAARRECTRPRWCCNWRRG